MTCSCSRSTLGIAGGIAALLLVTAHAQAPGGRGGAAPAAAPVATPRMPDGKPDLTGRWGGGGGGGGGLKVIDPVKGEVVFDNFGAYEEALASEKVSVQAKIIGREPGYRHGNNVYSERDSGVSQRAVANPPLYKPEFWERVQYLDENGNKEDSAFQCMPTGVPRMGPPMRILQTPTEVVFLYGARNTWRIIPTDGRPHDPVNSEDQTFMGDSVGHWEGDTLVVDVVGFNDFTWLGWPGWFHSNEMRVVERFRREGNTLRYDVTVNDPNVLMEPYVLEPRAINLNMSTSTAPYLEDPPCIDQDSAHIFTRERG